MASCMLGVTVVNGYFPSSQWKWSSTISRMANQLLVLDRVGIGFTILLRLSPRPTVASLKLVTVIPSQILLGIPQTRFRLSGSQECCQWILAYTTKILISDSDAPLFEGSRCESLIRNPRDIHSSLFSGRTEVVVRHAFISENGDECHLIITFIMFLCVNEYLRIRISLSWIEKQ